MDDFYLKLLEVIEILIDLDPDPDTPEGILLADLGYTLQGYEAAKQMEVRTRVKP